MKIASKISFLILLLCFLNNSAKAQVFPISSQIELAPPYPTNLDAYVDLLERGIIEVSSTSATDLEVYFQISLQETTGKITLNTNGILGTAVTIAPGMNLLTPNQIQEIFSDLTEADFISSGLSQAERDAIILNRQIPEGSYRLCVNAFDEIGTPLSDPSQGCIVFDVFFAERPVINIPQHNEMVDTSGFLLLNWDHIINSPDISNRLEYIVKIIDLTEQEISNYELAMLDPAVSPEYEEDFGNMFNANLQSEIDLPLIAGHQYAMRVTAIDPDQTLGFQYGGHSEIVVFSYGEEEEEEEEELAAPIITAPDHEDFLGKEEPLRVNITWEHEMEDEDLQALLTYEYKMIDLTELDETTYDYDDFDEENMFKTEVCDIEDPQIYIANGVFDGDLEEDHTYAIFIEVSTEDDRVEFENDGRSSIVEFTIGEEEVQPDAEEACGGDCLASLPTDQKAAPIKKGDNLFMGNLMLTVDEVEEDPNGGYKGEGSIFVNFIRQIHIKVDFEQLEANSKKYVFAGTADASYDETLTKLDGLIANAGNGALEIDETAAKALSTALVTGGKLASALAGQKTALPLGFDRDSADHKMVVGITEMHFTPEKATMTALFSIENPDWGEYVPTLGATDICFTRSGFGEVVKLYLGADYTIPLSNEQLVLKASEEDNPEEKGTYCIVDCKGFKQGQLTAEIGIPREVLLPENEDGTIAEDGFATLQLTGTFTKGSGYVLGASMSPCQIPGLEGFSLTMEDGYYDASDERNPDNMKFPKGYSRSETDELWKGVWFSNVMLQAPQDWGGADAEERTSVGIENFIKDDAGISVVASANNLLGIDKGSIEGFAFSVDKLSIDIIRGEFKEVKTEGRIGLPILPEGEYLDYEGIVDRSPEEDGKENNKAGANNDDVAKEALSMRFVVKPNEEGYDLDWIKSHIDFEESSEFILVNDAKRKGFAATMSGSLTLNSTMDGVNEQRDAGLPDIDLPGIKFEGMEISRMIDKVAEDGKKQNTGKNSTGGFTFKKPQFSYLGINLSDLNPSLDLPEEEEEEETEEEEKYDPKVNGFGMKLTTLDFSFGGEEGEEEVEMTDGKQVELIVAGEISLVKGKNGAKTKKDEGLAITASGGFKIGSTISIDGTNSKFEYNSFQMTDLEVDARVSAMRIYGKLGFYNDDKKFGNGALGTVNLELPICNVKIDGRFGSMPDYNYWYLFGDVRGGSKDKPIPIATFYNIISLYGFNGGAYYHMDNIGGLTPEERYVPSKTTLLGIEAGLTLSITKPNVVWGNPTLGAQFNTNGGLDKLTLRGRAYALKKEMTPNEDGEVEGVEAQLQAELNLKDEFNLTADMQIYANVGAGAVVGNMKDKAPYQMVDADLVINKDLWKFYLGTPTQPASVKVGIPGTDIGITANAYLMMGNDPEMPTASFPPLIKELLGKSNKDFSGGVSSLNSSRGVGFAFGANIEYNLDIKASILYAKFDATFGFDLSLTEYKNIICTNNGGKPIGLDGWYAKGKVYAGLKGDIGLDIDNFIYTGKISLASLSAVMALEGGFPNPFYATGRASMSFSVLGGLIEGSQSFAVDIGDQCDCDYANPFAGANFIAGLSPANANKDVSVFVTPKLSLNNRMGEYKYHFYDGSKRVEKKFRVKIDKYYVKDPSGNIVSGSYNGYANLEKTLNLNTRLKPYTKYTMYVSIKGDEYKNGWKPIKDGSKDWIEDKTITFTTGSLPNEITMNNVKITYPFINETNYLHGNNYFKTGLLKLKWNVDYLLKQKAKSTDEWIDVIKAKIYKGGTLVATTDFIDLKGDVIEFNMPRNLSKESVYQIKIVRTYKKNSSYRNTTYAVGDRTVYNYHSEGSYTVNRDGKVYSKSNSKRPPDVTLFSYHFATSKYHTMTEKLSKSQDQKVVPYVNKTFPVDLFQFEYGEGFTKAEIDQDIKASFTNNKGKIQIYESDTELHNNIKDRVGPVLKDMVEHLEWQVNSKVGIARLRILLTQMNKLAEAWGSYIEGGKMLRVLAINQYSTGKMSSERYRDARTFLRTTKGLSFRRYFEKDHTPFLFSNTNTDYYLNSDEKRSGVRMAPTGKAVYWSLLYDYHTEYNIDANFASFVVDMGQWFLYLENQTPRWNRWKNVGYGSNFYQKVHPRSSSNSNNKYSFSVTYSNPENPNRSGKNSYLFRYNVTIND